jgi:hypothetical protein
MNNYDKVIKDVNPDRSGCLMLYDKELDKSIVKELNDSDTLGYNELYRIICKSYRKIGKGDYDFHIKKLQNENAIQKSEVLVGKIKKSRYYLTKEGKQKHRLQILELKTEKEKSEYILANENERRTITYLLLIYDYRLMRSFKSRILDLDEKGLELQLQKCNTSRNALLINDDNHVNGIIKNNKRERVTAFKTKTDIKVFKFEKFNRKGEIKSTFYNMMLPGFSLDEYKENLNLRGIANTGFTNEEIEFGLANLLKEKVLEPVIEYDGQPRYVIIDDNLYSFIENLLLLTEYIEKKMDLVWAFIRRPTKEDIKWMELFIGIKNTQELLIKIREIRKITKKNKNLIQQARDQIYTLEKGIDKFIEHKKKEYADTIEKHAFPCNEILEIVYPKHFQKVLIN